MLPRLAAISGKLKGAIFAIDEDALIIGRETAANVCLADGAVSRRHSKIEKKDEGFVITDLESLNGTFVNGVPIRSRVLEHGDRVRIGDSQFLFLLHDGEPSKSSEVTLDEMQIVTGPTLHVRLDEAVFPDGAQPERANESQHGHQRDSRPRPCSNVCLNCCSKWFPHSAARFC